MCSQLKKPMTCRYLLSVRPDEYLFLKEEERTLLEQVRGSFNDTWRPRVKDITVTLKYNPNRRIVGMWLRRGEDEHLVVDESGLSEPELAFAQSLYSALEQKLTSIRLPLEDWVR